LSSSNTNNNTSSDSSSSTSTTDSSCQVVAIDFPGHGLSSHKSIDGPPALLAESIFYVNEALHQLAWDHETKPFTLIGHSMGAAIACLYAAAFPEQINKLILLEGGMYYVLISFCCID
jgi:pimeloyl-ACP methyl ester carboxylesterase